MFGLRFLLQCGSTAYNSFLAAFRGPAPETSARDKMLKSRFKRWQMRFVRRMNVMIPNTDNTNKIDVVAVMPTGSLDERRKGLDEKDSCVIFCVNNMSLQDKQAFFNANNDAWFAKVFITQTFYFHVITDPAFYKRFVVFMLSDCFKRLPRDILRLIANVYEDDYSTYFFAFWMAKDRRRAWMHDGINARNDNVLWLDNAMAEFDRMSDEAVEESRGVRASE